jgi:hypothetical protein
LLDLWARSRKGLVTGGLTYTKSGDTAHPLLESSPTHWEDFSVGWSLREVEPEVNLLLRIEAPELAERPDWTYGAPKGRQPVDPNAQVDEATEGNADDTEEDLLPTKGGGFDEAGPVNATDLPADPPQGDSQR